MRTLLLVVFLSVVPRLLIADSPEDALRRRVDEHEARYNAALVDGLNAIPVVSQFAKQFPRSIHFISYFPVESPKQKRIWNSETGIYGRYVLTMQVPILIDPVSNKVSLDGSPTFDFVSIDSITWLPDGQPVIQYGQPQLHFGLGEWRRFLERGGDFSALGLMLKRDSPVPGFDAVWKQA